MSKKPRLHDSVQGMRLSRPREDKADPLAIAAAFFAPRNTDTLEKWTRERLNQYLTPQQRMINESIIHHRYTAVPSAHSQGKSRFSAVKAGHWIDSHSVGTAFVVSTAPTSAQVESVLWRELNRVHVMADLRGRITRAGYPQWHIGDELVAYGRRPTEMASFQGIHDEFVLIILEEADGIPEPLWIAADSLASSGFIRVLAIGNPDSGDSYFSRIIRPGSGWNVVRCDGLRSPNFTKAEVSKYPDLKQYMIDNAIPPADSSVKEYPLSTREGWRHALLSPEWVSERMRRWGVVRFLDEDGTPRWRESALWMSKVRGVSPTEGSEGLIPLSWVEAAIRRWYEWQAAGSPTIPGRTIFGCDVADSGKDETVMSIRRQHVIEKLDRISQQDTETTGARIVGRMAKQANCIACVDAVGVGVGVVNYIRARKYPVIAYNGARKGEGMRDSTGEFTFKNQRSAAYWHLRELLDPVNGPNLLCLPDIEDLKVDLTIPTWKVKPGAVIEVEPKESVVKRLGRSPDCGDAVVMTVWPDSTPLNHNRIHEYSKADYEFEDWAPDPQSSLDPLDRRRQRLEALGEQTRQRKEAQQNHVFVYAGSATSSGWDDDPWP